MKRQFAHKISLGQNFLVNPRVSEMCLNAGGLSSSDVVLEIGPGQGALTSYLLKSEVSFVHAIEIDTRLSDWLSPLELEYPQKFKIFWGDVLKCELFSLTPLPTKVLANIPYNITSDLIWKILEELAPLGLKRVILLIQKEAAERLSAPPCTKDRCPLGITIQLMGGVKTIMKVSPGSFSPPPKVWSSLMKIDIKRNISLASETPWQEMLKAAFSQRRKKLINCLSNSSYSKDELTTAFKSADIPENARAEELTCEQWLALFKLLTQ